MSTHRVLFITAISLALGTPAFVAAQDLDARFSYLEGGFIGTFVNDVEDSGVVSGVGSGFELESDAGGGGFLNGAWQLGEHWHVFGGYSAASQDLEVRGGLNPVEGDYTVARWRVGVGYDHAISDRTAVYGRVSLDGTELKDLEVAGFNLNVDVDETGIGSEIGLIWAATPTVQLQGHVRYSAVGGIADDGTDSLESDTLLGLNGRWSFRPDVALIAGYEYGKITTFSAGVRFSF